MPQPNQSSTNQFYTAPAKARKLFEDPAARKQVEELFTVRTANGFVVSVTYGDDEPKNEFMSRKEEARRIAVAISRIPELMSRPK